jgi:hypothetical protein
MHFSPRRYKTSGAIIDYSAKENNWLEFLCLQRLVLKTRLYHFNFSDKNLFGKSF